MHRYVRLPEMEIDFIYIVFHTLILIIDCFFAISKIFAIPLSFFLRRRCRHVTPLLPLSLLTRRRCSLFAADAADAAFHAIRHAAAISLISYATLHIAATPLYLRLRADYALCRRCCRFF